MAAKKSDQPKPERKSSRAGLSAAWIAIAYVAIVLIADTMLVHPPSALSRLCFMLRVRVGGADLFKFTLWFIIPFIICLVRGMDWGALGVSRWKKVDWAILAGVAGVGVIVMLCIPLFPSVRGIYPSLSHLSAATKMNFFMQQLVWTLSWLIGWEFMHRYYLLRRVQTAWPKWGWLIIPLSEGLYHLQKPPVEAALMVAFSLIATVIVMRRKNILLPLLAHFLIEIELIAFMLVV
jgi:membrane protease YdiL (CAAX protease family)